VNAKLLKLSDPSDYFPGTGNSPLPAPQNILLFARHTKQKLQEEALLSRSHHRFVLIFNLETAGYVHIDHLTFRFYPGQMLLIHPFQFHHYSHLEKQKLKWGFCTFELDPQSFLAPLRNRIFKNSAAAGKLLAEILETWLAKKTGGQAEKLQALVLLLLIALKQSAAGAPAAVPVRAGGNILHRVNRFLHEHPAAGISDFAENSGVSESWLREKFRKTAGISLGSHIRNCRINRAMMLLRTTDLPVAEIAGETGFSSLQSFSRAFKTGAGKSPRAYRNSAG